MRKEIISLQGQVENVRFIRQQLGTLLIASAAFWLTGCYACMDDIEETKRQCWNNCRSYAAWWHVHDCYDDVPHFWHFSHGFRDGYRAAADAGGDVCIPSTPPRQYWSIHYQNCRGRERVNAWFEGYAHGILVAAQDGAANYSSMPTMGIQNYGAHHHAQHDVYFQEDLKKNVPAPTSGPTPLEPIPAGPPPAPAYDPPMTGHSSSGDVQDSKAVPMPNETDPFGPVDGNSEPRKNTKPAPKFEVPDEPVLPLPEVRSQQNDQNYRSVGYRSDSGNNGRNSQSSAWTRQFERSYSREWK